MLEDILHLRMHQIILHGSGMLLHVRRYFTPMDAKGQDIQDNDKTETVAENIATVKRLPKDEAIAQHVSRFPTQML